jgi:hypothetical protein
MIEKTVLDYLAGALSWPVVMETPETPPARYARIEKTGGGGENGLLYATLAVQSCAPTLYQAAEDNQTVKAAMAGLTALTNVFRCACDSDYNFTDTRTKTRRYQAVFQIVYKE